MTIEIEEATRKQVADFLPHAVKKAFESYYDFVNAEPSVPTKDKTRDKLFSEHHAACKAALAHIELLLKLGRLTGAEARADETHFAIIRAQAEGDANDHRGKMVPGAYGDEESDEL